MPYNHLQYQEKTEPVLATPETVTESRWHQPWSEPIVKIKVGLRAGSQQFLAFQPTPIIDISWFEELSKPQKLAKVGIGAPLQQTLAFHPAPSPFVGTGWFASLSEPVRIKPALKTSLQQFLANDTAVIPVGRVTSWFSPLSDPVRIKLGLRASLQQFYTGPSRLLPTSALFGTLSALETKDIFLAGVAVFNPPASAEIGIVDTGFPLTEIGIAVPAVASVSISIQIV